MKPTSLFDRVEEVLCNLYRCSLAASPVKDAYFRVLMDVDLDGVSKPLLAVGSTHPRQFGDGSCIAVLNPDESLLQSFEPGVGSNRFILNETVRKKCDLSLQLWINTIGSFRATRIFQYRSRHPAPPKLPWLVPK